MNDNSQDVETEPPALVYDAGCSICHELAYKIRIASGASIDLVALSDPEAERLLAEHYPDGWTEDFYLIETNRVRKGINALTRIVRHVGLRSFASLVGDYTTHKLQTRNCDHNDHDHAVLEEAVDGPTTTRRALVSAISIGAVPLLYPTSKLSKLDSPLSGAPPEKIAVNVAEVSPDGDGGFMVEISQHPDAVRSSHPNPSGSPRVDMHAVNEEELDSEDLGNGADMRIRRADKRAEVIRPDKASNEIKEAITESNEVTIYTGQLDHNRFGVGVNMGHGPVVTNAGSSVATTLSTRINHDVADPVVDFIMYQDEATTAIGPHVDAYAVAIDALADFHDERRGSGLASVYRTIADNMGEFGDRLQASIDGELRPVANQVAISGIPDFTQYVEVPTVIKTPRGDQGTVIVKGTSCGCGCCCNCCCSCGCGCGCGLCGCTCGCGCCCGCGCSCSCGCCVTDVCG